MAARRFVRRVVSNALFAGSAELQSWAESGTMPVLKEWIVRIANAVDDLIEAEIDRIVAYAQANPSLTKAQLLTAIRAGLHRDNTA